MGQLINVRVDVTIGDKRGSSPPVTKTVTLITADREAGSIRTSANMGGGRNVPLNVDARPAVEGDRIRVRLTLEYGLAAETAKESGGGALQTIISESLGLVLESGKPLMVAQAADPVADRQVTVEVKATVMK